MSKHIKYGVYIFFPGRVRQKFALLLPNISMAPRSNITKKHGRAVVLAQSMVNIRKYGEFFAPVLLGGKILKFHYFHEKLWFYITCMTYYTHCNQSSLVYGGSIITDTLLTLSIADIINLDKIIIVSLLESNTCSWVNSGKISCA